MGMSDVWRRAGVPARVWLAVVAAVFGLAQVVLVADVPLGWDESVYASQTDPRRPALVFSAPRARGMSWLVAPIQAVTGSPEALRVYLAVLAAVGLYAAYAVWLRVRADGSVPLAALALSTLWVTVFYGPTTMPNVAIALACVFASGALLCDALGLAPAWLRWAGGAAVGLATLVRPGDVAPLLGALGVAVLAHPQWRRRAVRLLVPAAVGSVAGAVPWLVEAQLRYGGIPARVYRALSTQGTGERFVPDYQLRALDGPILCRPCVRADQPIPAFGVVLWVVGAALVVAAVWLALRERRTAAPGATEATLLSAWVGGVLAFPYLFLVGYAAPRFMLPAYALLALPVGQALLRLSTARGGRLRLVPAGLVAVALVAHSVVQYRVLEDVLSAQTASRTRWVAVADALAARGVAPPCTLLGPSSPTVAYVAGCDAVTIQRHAGDEAYSLADLRAAVERERVAVVLRGREPRPDYTRGWVQVPARELPSGYRVLIAP
jgi:4-amino-4-deoxy-L-arabinose transferase-like glycosyltransferase